MLKVFPIFRVTLLNIAGGKEFYFFTQKVDADWFASHFKSVSVDVLNQISMVECSDEDRDCYLRLIKNGAVNYSETF